MRQINVTKPAPAKRIVFSLILLCGVVGTIELMAWAAYCIRFQESFSYHKLQTLRRAVLYPTAPEFPYVIHPFYGYVINPTIKGVTRQGFLGREDQIQSGGPDKIIIAIMGGSVATYFAVDEAAHAVLKSQLKKVPALQDKSIVIVNLANIAFKEPQDLMVINDILSRGGHIDILIALDGFNEIAEPEVPGNVDTGMSPFFPFYWQGLASESTLGARVWLASIFSRPILRYWTTANLIWRVADDQLAKAHLNAAGLVNPTTRLSNDRRIFLGPRAQYASRRDLYMETAVQWGRSSVLLNNIMAAQGGFFFHFLQPNQYVAGSKPLTEHETEVAISPSSPVREPVEIGYPYLRAVGESFT